jgi:hypothetical protein
MTNEERRKLCADLLQVYRYINNDDINELVWRAVDEIERLVAALEACREEYGITDKERERVLSENRKLKRERVAAAMGWKDD